MVSNGSNGQRNLSYLLPQNDSGKPVSLFRIDIWVGLWGIDGMYSGVLNLDEAVLRNLGLRMLGELQWAVLRVLEGLLSFSANDKWPSQRHLWSWLGC
jgi:hypothetical protein